MSELLAAALLFALAAGRPDDARADLQERLQEERKALEALKGGKKDLLGVIDGLERGARAQAARAAGLERELAKARGRVARARAAQARAALARRGHEAAIAPRLVSLYRLTRQSQLATLSTAADFAALVRRERALASVVDRDLAALETLALLARAQRWRAERLLADEALAQELSRGLLVERQLLERRREALQGALASLGQEEARAGKLLRELEAQDRALGELVREIEREGGESSLKAKKGHLPFPTRGIVEVAFGKVVNPRFNTVTVQKGIDVRARAGEKVSAIAPGTVVYSDWLKGYGNLVIVDHGGAWHSLYAHLLESEVEVGNEVEEGESLGAVGDTGSLKGNYLYFELRKNGEALDPLPWFDPESIP